MKRPTILVADRGSFLPFAMALAKDADILYYSEFRDVAPASQDAMVGRDMPGITRVDSMWKNIDDVDVIAFPDVGDGDMQTWLRKQGYAVWGTGDAEMLELDRSALKSVMRKLGEPVIPTRNVVGLEALRAILEDEEDLYLKTSFFRADMETRHHETWHRTQEWFYKLWHALGPRRHEIEVLVESPMPGVEIGYEGYVIDGQFPGRCAYGLERKDSSYLGVAVDADDLPACLAHANAVLSEPLKLLGARGNYHNEIRINDAGTAYINDPCMRCGSPPFGAMSLWITNWVDIVVEGAHGRLVDPEFTTRYAAEIELTRPENETDWLPIDVTPEAEPWLRLRRACMMDDKYWVVPDPWLNIIGSVVGLGDSPATAITMALEMAEQVEGEHVTYNHQCKDELLTGWSEALDACKAPAKAA